MNPYIERENHFGAQHYAPIPVVLTRGEGVYVWDVDGKKYLDMMSAYSAVSHGHSNPKLLKVFIEQAKRLGIVSRAFYTDKLGAFLEKVCEVTGMDRTLPMNTGAEAVETALKAARKWAYTVKGVSDNKAEIIACHGNFHGRTISIVAMSSDPQYKFGFGPFSPGFKLINYGNAKALENAITPNTAAFIVEPIQGEGGILMPPKGYLKECSEICKKHNVLLICDEIQTGLGRTGSFLACDHEDVVPDGLTLGKALGGGLFPISVFVSKQEVMEVFTPGDHGSTFGGNPIASVVAVKAIDLLFEENLIEKSKKLGEYFMEKLKKIKSPLITDIRGKGLFIGVELDTDKISARYLAEQLMEKGLLTKETHETVLRFCPPLIIEKKEIDLAVQLIEEVFTEAK